MSKGSAQNAAGNTGIGRNNFYDLSGKANAVNSQLFPFLNSEIHNPQGYGKGYINDVNTLAGEQQTASGQSVAGALGSAEEKANLLGARTGNTAATPGIIDAVSRNALKQNSNNILNVGMNKENMLLQNEVEKARQQQAGAAGMQGLYGQDLEAALKSLGLSNEAINAWTQGKSAANHDINSFLDTGLTALGMGGFSPSKGIIPGT